MCVNEVKVQIEKGSSTRKESTAKRSRGLQISFRDLKYSVPLKKKQSLTILKNLAGSFEAGKATALLGPSGSGKTTLMDVLSNRKTVGKIEGEILFGGRTPTKKMLRRLCGYVEQFDTLVGELTVRQMLMYTAELKLTTNFTKKDKELRVQEALETLGLTACADTVIGGTLKRGVSGGQLKRTNIALSLISQPPVIFLDEPTSGLDSFMANEVATVLRELARLGRTIVCTIHSPTAYAFSCFDAVMMLRDGMTIYEGPQDHIGAFFETSLGRQVPAGVSLPEFLVDLTAGSQSSVMQTFEVYSAEYLASQYADSEFGKKRMQANLEQAKALEASPTPIERDGHHPGPLKALSTILSYRMLKHYKSGEYLGPRIGDKFIFGLLILTLYWGIGSNTDVQSIQSTASLLYFIVALCGYGAAAFVPSLTLDRPLFYREVADGCYHPLVYYLSKFIEEATLCVLTSFLFSLLVFFACKLQGSFFIFVLSYYLTTMMGILIAYGVAAVVPTLEAANALLPTYVTLCMYFGGLFLLFDKIPDAWFWFSWTSFLRYAWGAMMNNQFGDSVPGEQQVFRDETGALLTVNDFYGMEGDIMGSVWACLGFLVLLCLVFATCGACSLMHIRHDSR